MHCCVLIWLQALMPQMYPAPGTTLGYWAPVSVHSPSVGWMGTVPSAPHCTASPECFTIAQLSVSPRVTSEAFRQFFNPPKHNHFHFHLPISVLHKEGDLQSVTSWPADKAPWSLKRVLLHHNTGIISSIKSVSYSTTLVLECTLATEFCLICSFPVLSFPTKIRFSFGHS